LAAEGIRFTDAHSPSALCTPTRYGILTGRYYWRTPKRHALVMPYEPPVIEADRLTLPKMLGSVGYRSACIGKWHLGFRYPSKLPGEESTQIEADVDFSRELEGGPIDCGFDSFFGTAGCSTSDSPYCFIENRRTAGIPNVPSTDDLHALPGFYPGLMVGDWDEERVDERHLERAVRFLDDHLASYPDTPFFLYLAISAPHNPWLPPDFAKGKSGEGARGDMNVLVDWCVGSIYEALADRGILDDTLLIFTSDNGPMKGENGQASAGKLREYKNTAFEGGHRIPFVARWPNHIEPGTEADDLICLSDLFATFAEMTGARIPEGAAEDSFSVLPALASGSLRESDRRASQPCRPPAVSSRTRLGYRRLRFGSRRFCHTSRNMEAHRACGRRW
jgi:arylsulfatase A-like enzyme